MGPGTTSWLVSDVGNVLNGQGGNDQISGNAATDQLNGGDGDDNINPGSGNDAVDGGTGTNTVDYSSAGAGGVGIQVNLATGTASGDGNDTIANIQNVVGSSFADSITGDDNNNRISGRGGNDAIQGKGGDDNIQGKARQRPDRLRGRCRQRHWQTSETTPSRVVRRTTACRAARPRHHPRPEGQRQPVRQRTTGLPQRRPRPRPLPTRLARTRTRRRRRQLRTLEPKPTTNPKGPAHTGRPFLFAANRSSVIDCPGRGDAASGRTW